MISQFIWSIKKDEHPIIYGDGTQTRDFTFVKDVCRANILAAEAKNISSDIFNVGTGIATNLNDIISILKDSMKKDVSPKYVEVPVKNYITTQQADIKKISSMLGYKPEFSVVKGVEETLKYIE